MSVGQSTSAGLHLRARMRKAPIALTENRGLTVLAIKLLRLALKPASPLLKQIVWTEMVASMAWKM